MNAFDGCVICKSRKIGKKYHKFGHDLVRCRKCGLVFSEPGFDEEKVLNRYGRDFFVDEYLPIFNADERSFDLELINRHYSLFLNMLAPFFEPGKKMLDVGCGAGFFLKAASERGWDAEGVEISDYAAEYARGVVKQKVYTGKLESVDLTPASYDIITLLDTIEHLFTPHIGINLIYKLLSKGGILFIQTPDYNSLSRLLLGKDWAVLSPFEHIHYFSHKTLNLLLEREGFEQININNHIFFHPDYTHDKKALRYKLWRKSYAYIAQKPFFKKIQKINLHELRAMSDVFFEIESPAIFRSRVKALLYSGIRRILKGDGLIAIAKK